MCRNSKTLENLTDQILLPSSVLETQIHYQPQNLHLIHTIMITSSEVGYNGDNNFHIVRVYKM